MIICLPKRDGAQTPADYRPIALLIVDYILLARIIARRLRPLLAEFLQSTQFFGVPGNSILDAVATVWDAIAQSEVKTHSSVCTSLDFREAFDKVSHN